MHGPPSVRRALRAASVAASVSFLLAVPAVAQTDSGWEQYQGDAARTGSAVQGPEPPYRVQWEREAGIGTPEDLTGFPMPIVVGDLVVVVGRESVDAVDVSDGAQVWSTERALGPSVPAAAARTADGTVIVVTEGGGEADATPAETPSSTSSPAATASPTTDLETSSVLLGLDAETGERLWESPLPDLSRTGATVLGDRAIVGTDGGDVVAVDVTTGDQVWVTAAGDQVVLPLAAAGDLVLAPTATDEVAGSAALVGLEIADGDEAWRHTSPGAATAVGSPSVARDVAFVALGDRTVEALRLSDGSVLWSSSMNQVGILPPVILEDLVVTVDGSGQVFAFDPVSGERLWDHALNLGVFGPPVAVPDAILVPGDGGTIASLDPDTGDLIFRTTIVDGYLLGVAVAQDTVAATVTGPAPGLIGITHDDDGSLVRVPSPTIMNLPALLGLWVVAAVPLTALLWFIGRWLWASLGPIDVPTGDDPDLIDADTASEGSAS